MNSTDLVVSLSLIFLNAWACALLLVDQFIPPGRKGMTALLAALGLLGSLGFVIYTGFLISSGRIAGGPAVLAFNGMVVVDGYSIFLSVLFLASGLLGVALAHDYLRRMSINRGEYYPLLLLSIGGMMLMSMAADLIVVFLALELLSIPLYVLSGFARPRSDSEEAALKYFLLGAFSTGFVVYGVALVFGATGTTSITGIVEAVSGAAVQPVLLLVGAALVLIGLGFKVAAVPFHMWTPDVYHGAPTSIVGFMAVGAKAGGFAALLRVFFTAFPALSIDLAPVIWGLAAATMILGNIVAIAQTNIKRLLAYSSIAHAGYILMALVPFGQEETAGVAVASALVYLVAYAVTNFAAWAVVIALEKAGGQGLQLNDYAGLGRTSPFLAAVMTIAMLSFIGVPPTLGFVGKFYLFRTAMESGYIGLALIGVITSLISAYYYLRVVVIMYMRDGEPATRSETWLNLAAGASALATLLLIVVADPLFDWASRAVLGLTL